MLRSVLRNVQYYLLFFSILLVLLAFQRLQLLDPHLPYAFHDRPGAFHTPTSQDLGRVYYGGDESKEIGLFKIRLGMFKFVLPTFATDEDSWERTNELSTFMRVPPPPNKQRRGRKEKLNFFRLQDQQEESDASVQEEDAVKNASHQVAYLIIIPSISTLHTSSSDQFYQKRANVLSQSIARAHTKSSYKYHSYALNLNRESTGDDEGERIQKIHEALTQSGFSIINLSNGDDNIVNEQTSQSDFVTLMNQHDVIVQLCLNSFLLKPLDSLYDILINGDDKNTETSKSKTATEIDAFVLESSNLSATSVEEELLIYKTSQEVTKSYMQSLDCLISSKQSTWEQKQVAASQNQENVLRRHSRIRSSIKVARKNQEVDPTVVETDALSIHQMCRVSTKQNVELLDRCLYDVGGIIHECSHVLSIKNEALIAHFGNVNTGPILEAKQQDNEPQKNDGSFCTKQPWEYSRKADCVNSYGNRQQTCKWLCEEWFVILDKK